MGVIWGESCLILYGEMERFHLDQRFGVGAL